MPIIGVYMKIQCKQCPESIYIRMFQPKPDRDLTNEEQAISTVQAMGEMMQQGFTPADGDYVCFKHRGDGDFSGSPIVDPVKETEKT